MESKTLDNQDKDFEIFSIPLLLSIDEVFEDTKFKIPLST
jgi:hypothetical protein